MFNIFKTTLSNTVSDSLWAPYRMTTKYSISKYTYMVSRDM